MLLHHSGRCLGEGRRQVEFNFLLENEKTGHVELITPPLERGDILPGVTRRSILELARKWGEFDVVEWFPMIPDNKENASSERLLEAFGAGTAAVVSPIE